MSKKRAVFIFACILCLSITPVIMAYGTEADLAAGYSAKVYQEQSTDSAILANLIVGNVFNVVSAQKDASGNVWYYVVTDFGVQGYVQAAEMDGLIQAAAAASAALSEAGGGQDHSDNQAAEDTNGGQAITQNLVNLRQELSTDSEVLSRISAGTTIQYTEVITDDNGELWYKVAYGDKEGYVNGEALIADGGTVPEQQGAAEPADYEEAGDADAQGENIEEPAEDGQGEDADGEADVQEAVVNQEDGVPEPVSDFPQEQEPGTAVSDTDTDFIFAEEDGLEAETGQAAFHVEEKRRKGIQVDFLMPVLVISGALCIIVIIFMLRRILYLMDVAKPEMVKRRRRREKNGIEKRKQSERVR